jgi:hypothetical protein
MKINEDKIDEMTLALMFLGLWDEPGEASRTWKGFEFDTLDRLHKKGFIGDPKDKSKSVSMTPEGRKKAEELFKKHFALD